DVLDRDVLAAEFSGGDSASIENKAWQVHARQGHGSGGNRLIASHHANNRIEKLTAADQFDGIGNDLAAHQRGTHAFGAHGFAVGNRDGVELHRRSASRANALLYLLR